MGSAFDHLTDDIMIDILRRLSYKQSHRCLSVCQHWHTLISHPSFLSKFPSFVRANHRILQPFMFIGQICAYTLTYTTWDHPVPIDHHLYNTTSPDMKPILSLDFLPPSNNIVFVLKSSIDLLLCSEDLHKHSIYYVCNPTSKRWVSLPPTPSPHRMASIGFYCDVSYDECDQNDDCTVWIINNPQIKYIVLRYLHISTLGLELEIFSSKSNTWKYLVESVPLPYFRPSFWINKSTIHNGMIWATHENLCIISYKPDHSNDNGRQRWNFIVRPSDICDHNYSNSFLGVTNGRLRIAQIITYKDKLMIENTHGHDLVLGDLEPSLRIWEFDDSTREWSLVHKIYLKDLDEEFNNRIRCIKEVHFHPVDGDNICIRLNSGYFECNVRVKTTKFHAVKGEEGSHSIHTQLPFMMPLFPTPLIRTNLLS
ncbi:hypothetical protein ACFE04_001327 [Oxalis oulophora]